DLDIGDGEVAAGDLLGDHAGGQGALVASTERRRELGGDQPELAHPSAQLRGDGALLLPLPDVGSDLGGDLGGRVDVALHHVVDDEIHGASFGEGWSGGGGPRRGRRAGRCSGRGARAGSRWTAAVRSGRAGTPRRSSAARSTSASAPTNGRPSAGRS